MLLSVQWVYLLLVWCHCWHHCVLVELVALYSLASLVVIVICSYKVIVLDVHSVIGFLLSLSLLQVLDWIVVYSIVCGVFVVYVACTLWLLPSVELSHNSAFVLPSTKLWNFSCSPCLIILDTMTIIIIW